MPGGKEPLHQLPSYKEEHKGQAERATDNFGIPPPSLTNSLTVGKRGPILLQDTNLVDHLAAFDRERIPERVVHAKGGGAFGYFEATHDISQYCKAKVFNKGQKTPIAIRFSTVGGELGSADTARDPRGFAVKFYTDDGVWDLVGNNTPIFFLRDPMLFPSFIHTQKRNPQTHLKDPNMMWDFISLRPETLHQVSFLFSERGLPDGFRHMHGFGSHTFKLVNSNNKPVYCKFHMKTAQGVKNLDPKKAQELAGADPDYSIRDLYDSILNGNFPAWNMFIQVMTFEEAESVNFDPFDLTKVWSQKDYPLLPVGKLVLNRNPTNYFNDVEQIAFCPGNMPPGIEASPDRMLQGRLFSYKDTQRHRLGPNFHQIPVNRPIGKNGNIFTYTRDGLMNQDTHQGNAPHYFPNSFGGPTVDPANAESKFSETGDVERFDHGNDDNYSQVKIFWEQVLSDKSRAYLARELGGNLAGAIKEVRDRTIGEFSKVTQEMGDMIKAEVEKALSK